jgi:hypothetical protein
MLDDIIQNTTTEFDGEVFSYLKICARWEGECFTNDILNLDYILPEVIACSSVHLSSNCSIMLHFRRSRTATCRYRGPSC